MIWSTTFILAGYLLSEDWATSSIALHHTFKWIGSGVMVIVVGLVTVMMFHY
ncbi:MAG TPA: hypothetical protein PKD12_03055 [Nitrospira sp.]|nr:hypothetical protein [Nitrospira sp.]